MVKIARRYSLDGQTGRSLDESADKERAQRKNTIDKYWRYYDGEHPKPLIVRPGERDDNIIDNLFQSAVDEAVEFIGVPRRYDLPGGRDFVPRGNSFDLFNTEAQEMTDRLHAVYADMIPEIIQSGLISGHVFMKLFVDETGPQARLLDPRMVTVYEEAMNPRKLVFYRLQWEDGRDIVRQDILPVDLAPESVGPAPANAGWLILDTVKENGRGEWKPVNAEWWLFDFAPIVEWRNKRRAHQYYGRSEYHNAEQLQDSLNFANSNIGRILKYHAHPRVTITGGTLGQIAATSIDGVWEIPNENASVNVLEMQSDLGSSMAFRDGLRADFFNSVRVIDRSAIKDTVGGLTNFGVRMLYGQQLAMSEEKRRFYGDGIGEVYRRLLLMAGFTVTEAPIAIWADSLPVNRLEQLQAMQIENNLGIVSKQTMSQDLGRDYEREADQRAEETQESGALLGEVLAAVGESGGF